MYSCPGVKVTQGHACQGRFRGSFQPLRFSLYGYPDPPGHLLEQTNARFGISAYELTIYDSPCDCLFFIVKGRADSEGTHHVKVMKGHPRLYKVTDLG